MKITFCYNNKKLKLKLPLSSFILKIVFKLVFLGDKTKKQNKEEIKKLFKTITLALKYLKKNKAKFQSFNIVEFYSSTGEQIIITV